MQGTSWVEAALLRREQTTSEVHNIFATTMISVFCFSVSCLLRL